MADWTADDYGVNFENVNKELLNHYLEHRYGEATEGVFASSQASTAQRLTFAWPERLQQNTCISDLIFGRLNQGVDDYWSQPQSSFGENQGPTSSASCAPFFAAPDRVIPYNKRPKFGALRPHERESFDCKMGYPGHGRKQSNWENLPRIVFSHLREIMSIEKVRVLNVFDL